MEAGFDNGATRDHQALESVALLKSQRGAPFTRSKPLSAQTIDGWGSKSKASSSEDLDPEAHKV